MTSLISLSKASKILGVDEKTLRRWDAAGTIKAVRTVGGHRRIPQEEIDRLLQVGESDGLRIKTLAYCRCSTHKQTENLERQIGRVLEFCNKNKWLVELYKEIGSGLNEKRREFKRLLKQISEPDTKRVVVEFKDRIARFGFAVFEQFCNSYGVELVIIEESEAKEFEQEFSEDIVSLITSYSARLYGRRGGRKRQCGK